MVKVLAPVESWIAALLVKRGASTTNPTRLVSHVIDDSIHNYMYAMLLCASLHHLSKFFLCS
jgi:hypothetical protein